MRALSAGELLSVWEQGVAQPAAQRALTLLVAGYPEATSEALGRLSVGQRDRRLLQFRASTFGPELVCVAACPECDERLELTLNVAEIMAPPEDGAEDDGAPLTVETDGYEISFRLPNSLDLAATADCADAATARRLILRRCLLSARQDGGAADLADLPAAAIDAMVAQMARLDPQADVRLALSCPVCGSEWEAPFDIVSFLWRELDTWAYRVLHEVHALATAYGWREADILKMSPVRRRLYLEMIGT